MKTYKRNISVCTRCRELYFGYWDHYDCPNCGYTGIEPAEDLFYTSALRATADRLSKQAEAYYKRAQQNEEDELREAAQL